MFTDVDELIQVTMSTNHNFVGWIYLNSSNIDYI